MHEFFEKNMGADICLVNTGAHLDDAGDLYDIWENIQPWVNEYKVRMLVYHLKMLFLVIIITLELFKLSIIAFVCIYRLHITPLLLG